MQKKQTRNRRNPLGNRLNIRISDRDRETINSVAADWSTPSDIGRTIIHWYCESVRQGKTLTYPLQFVESIPKTPPIEPKPRDKK